MVTTVGVVGVVLLPQAPASAPSAASTTPRTIPRTISSPNPSDKIGGVQASRPDFRHPVSRIGLIAGNGRFPFLALQGARSLGHDVTVVAVKEEAFPELEGAAREAGAELHWVSLGQLGKCIKILKQAGALQAVMAGQVKHAKIFSGIIPDFTFLSVLTKLRARNTDALISAVAEVLRDEGIELLNSTAFLEPLLARAGTLSERAPTE